MVLQPEDLIISLLMRLPVKSLLRFRCVSNLWLSLTSDPRFARSHFQLAAARTHGLVYLPASAYASQARSIDFHASLHDDSASAALNLDFLPPMSYSRDRIMGSCRGLLLLNFDLNLYLWNPSTGARKPLSLSPIASNVNVFFFTFLYGFGYDPSTDDYLVVLASYDPSADLATHFELFSLIANAWKKIEGTGTHLPHMNGSDDPRAGTLLNGELGFLSVCVSGDDTADIWVMEQYKVQSSWTKSIVVSIDGLSILYFSPVSSTKSGDVVGIDGSTGLVKCNAKGQLLEHRSYCDDPHGCEAAVYAESLLSLRGDSGQAGEDDSQKVVTKRGIRMDHLVF